MSMAQQTCCLRVAAGRSLYVSVYALPHPHGWAISQIKKELIGSYRPLSNLDSLDGSTELAHKLSSVETKIAEQDTLLKLALAAISQVQLQQPEPRKKIAGFRPYPAGSPRSSSGKAQTDF
jgi:hypothetical protein